MHIRMYQFLSSDFQKLCFSWFATFIVVVVWPCYSCGNNKKRVRKNLREKDRGCVKTKSFSCGEASLKLKRKITEFEKSLLLNCPCMQMCMPLCIRMCMRFAPEPADEIARACECARDLC